MQIDRVHFYVEDARKWRDWFVDVMGFQSIASGSNSHTHTEVVASNCIKFVLSSAISLSSPVAKYLSDRPPGVVDIAFRVFDLESLLERAIAMNARIKQPIQQKNFVGGKIKWCEITGINSLNHTLVERIGITPLLPESWILENQELSTTKSLFTGIDHLVLNVASEELEQTVNWYEKVFGFEREQSFKIQTETSGLHSQVLFHPFSGIQLPVNQPMSANSQIQEFLDLNRGAGIQHIALKTSQILGATQRLRLKGLSFLSVPHSYYQTLRESERNFPLSDREFKEIIKQQILIDLQLNKDCLDRPLSINRPILLQIFTQPIFSQPTFFFELIERRDRANGFGERNFQALFEAIEREQLIRNKS
jgi:4-hydroxyphenylpyruvate dioxygenase